MITPNQVNYLVKIQKDLHWNHILFPKTPLEVLEKIDNNHPGYSKMSLLLCKILEQRELDYIFLSAYYRDLFLRLYPNTNNWNH